MKYHNGLAYGHGYVEGQIGIVWTYLNIGIAQSSDTVHLASGDSRCFESKHRLENAVELGYAGRHGGSVDLDTAYFTSRGLINGEITVAEKLRQVLCDRSLEMCLQPKGDKREDM